MELNTCQELKYVKGFFIWHNSKLMLKLILTYRCLSSYQHIKWNSVKDIIYIYLKYVKWTWANIQNMELLVSPLSANPQGIASQYHNVIDIIHQISFNELRNGSQSEIIYQSEIYCIQRNEILIVCCFWQFNFIQFIQYQCWFSSAIVHCRVMHCFIFVYKN